VAKLNTYGVLQWDNSYGSLWATGSGIALDSSSHVYITGETMGGWGTIIEPCSTYYDAYLAQLNVSDGEDVWFTCIGVKDGGHEDVGRDVDVGQNGHIYLVGESDGSWGSPVQPYAGDSDAWVAEYNSSGEFISNTFQGSAGDDAGKSIVVDANNIVYITGYSYANWGQPVLLSGGSDAFVSTLGGLRVFLPIIRK
jgi:hypothetical protein